MGIKAKIKAAIKRVLLKRGIRTNKHIVVFESDDWGAVRVSSKENLEKLKEKYPDKNFDWYQSLDGLERDEDVMKLAEVLSQFKDARGNSAKFTLNFATKNPDFEEIRKSNYKNFFLEEITESYARFPDSKNVLSLVKEAKNNVVLFPQLHSREHLNSRFLMEDLNSNALVKDAFDLDIVGVSDGNYCQLETLNNAEKNDEILTEAVQTFNKIFGYFSKTFIAPCYCFRDDDEKILSTLNVEILQGKLVQNVTRGGRRDNFKRRLHKMGEYHKNSGLYYFYRNCFFEPSRERMGGKDEEAIFREIISQIELAFKSKKPAIICSHRANWTSRVDSENRDKNLELLKKILDYLTKNFSDIIFLSSDELKAELFKNKEELKSNKFNNDIISIENNGENIKQKNTKQAEKGFKTYGFLKRIRQIISLFKFMLMFFPALIFKMFIKNSWLICEDKFEARDNGYWLYKYIRVNHKERIVHFAISKKSSDYLKIKKLGGVVKYDSLAHWFWFIVASCNISSQASGRPENGVAKLLEKIGLIRNKFCFLQHGVIINDLKWLYADRNKIDWFLTSATPEYESIVKNYGYREGVVKLLGLPRFDNLHNASVNNDEILVIPTWRTWIKNPFECTIMNSAGKLNEENFLESEYFLKWNEFLNSEKLNKILEKYNKHIIFYPHRNLQRFIDCFDNKFERVKFAKRLDYDIQDLLKACSLMITDYSSVFMDVVYMKKPVLFYQFDEEKFRRGQYDKGYFDYKKYSLWADNLDDCLDNLEKILSGKAKLKYEIKDLFPFYDDKNSERVYNSISEIFDR